MFNIREMDYLIPLKTSKGKTTARYKKLNDEEEFDLYLNNTRTKRTNKITFKKIENGYKAILNYSDRNDILEKEILNSGEITHMAFESLISFTIKKKILYIIAPKEMEIFE